MEFSIITFALVQLSLSAFSGQDTPQSQAKLLADLVDQRDLPTLGCPKDESGGKYLFQNHIRLLPNGGFLSVDAKYADEFLRKIDPAGEGARGQKAKELKLDLNAAYAAVSVMRLRKIPGTQDQYSWYICQLDGVLKNTELKEAEKIKILRGIVFGEETLADGKVAVTDEYLDRKRHTERDSCTPMSASTLDFESNHKNPKQKQLAVTFTNGNPDAATGAMTAFIDEPLFKDVGDGSGKRVRASNSALEAEILTDGNVAELFTAKRDDKNGKLEAVANLSGEKFERTAKLPQVDLRLDRDGNFVAKVSCADGSVKEVRVPAPKSMALQPGVVSGAGI